MNELNLSEEIWSVVKEHYVKECYSDCITDIILYLYSIIRDKTGIDTDDGERLVGSAFSEKNPKLLINKNVTLSEKDEQRGFLYLFKWLTASLRNPVSHDKKYKFTKDEVDSILLLINNYVMKRLDDSIEFSYVDDWYSFIFVNNNLDSKDYSESIVDSIPKKKMLELLIKIIDNLDEIDVEKYSYLINLLYSKQTIKNKENICGLLNAKLLNNSDINYFTSFFSHFDSNIYGDLNRLTKSKLSSYVEKQLEDFKEDKDYKNFIIYSYKWSNCFTNANRIEDRLMYFLTSFENSASFIAYRMKEWYMNSNIIEKYHDLIIEQLEKGNIYLLYVLNEINEKCTIEDEIILDKMSKFKKSNEWIDLPF